MDRYTRSVDLAIGLPASLVRSSRFAVIGSGRGIYDDRLCIPLGAAMRAVRDEGRSGRNPDRRSLVYMIAGVVNSRTQASNTLAACLSFASKAGREAAGLGLVFFSISDTSWRRLAIELDANHIRALRLRKAIITGARLHDEEVRTGSTRGAWYMLIAIYRSGSDAGARDVSELVKRIRGHFHRIVG
jgi:hypothetical protein